VLGPREQVAAAQLDRGTVGATAECACCPPRWQQVGERELAELEKRRALDVRRDRAERGEPRGRGGGILPITAGVEDQLREIDDLETVAPIEQPVEPQITYGDVVRETEGEVGLGVAPLANHAHAAG